MDTELVTFDINLMLSKMERYTLADRQRVFEELEDRYCRHCGLPQPYDHECQCPNHGRRPDREGEECD